MAPVNSQFGWKEQRCGRLGTGLGDAFTQQAEFVFSPF